MDRNPNKKDFVMTLRLPLLLLVFALLNLPSSRPAGAQDVRPTAAGPSLNLQDARVQHRKALDLLVFEQTLAGTAGATKPEAAGQLDGAPVLSYVFPTTLPPTAVGFGDVDGTLALVATSHPDFDDTPLWDENGDANPDNDGRVYHSHWIVLQPDDRVAGGLAVREIEEGSSPTMPATHPDMPLYLDSPGHSIVLEGNTIKVLVPASRVAGTTEFTYDAVTAYLEVNTSDESRPMLGVYEVYDVLSGDLSLPYSVAEE